MYRGFVPVSADEKQLESQSAASGEAGLFHPTEMLHEKARSITDGVFWWQMSVSYGFDATLSIFTISVCFTCFLCTHESECG